MWAPVVDKSWLLGYDVELGHGETGGEAVVRGERGDDHAWLTGVGDAAREERLVPTEAFLVVHGAGSWWWFQEHGVDLVFRRWIVGLAAP